MLFWRGMTHNDWRIDYTDGYIPYMSVKNFE